MSYKHKTGTFKGVKDTELFYQSWLADSPSGALIIVHGLGEHSGRYKNVLNVLKGDSISVYSFDQRGFGKSQGKRGCVDSFRDYIEDVKIFVAKVKSDNNELPVIMLGHSLGGLIAAMFAIEYGDDINGLILSSPAFLFTGEVPWWKKAAAKLMTHISPNFSLSSGDDYSGLSHDPAYIEECKKDKLLHNFVSARLYDEFLKSSVTCMSKAFELSIPFFIFHGNADPITDYKGSEIFFQRASSKDKELKIFDGLYHKTMNEIPQEREKVLAMVSAWIKNHTAKKAAPKPSAAKKKAAAKKPAVKKTAISSVTKKTPAKKAAVKSNSAKSTVKNVKKK